MLFFLNIMHKVKAERSGELFIKNMLILQHPWSWKELINIGKNSSRNFWKDWNKHLEIFREKFLEISELTTLMSVMHMYVCQLVSDERLQLMMKLAAEGEQTPGTRFALSFLRESRSC